MYYLDLWDSGTFWMLVSFLWTIFVTRLRKVNYVCMILYFQFIIFDKCEICLSIFYKNSESIAENQSIDICMYLRIPF